MVTIKLSSISVVGLLLLSIFFGIMIFDDKTIFNARGATLYVGGSGGSNYTKIQYAVENASSGNTIRIYDGDYNEMLVIDKGITIIGNGSSTTRIYHDAGGYLIEATAFGVNITGLTIDGMDEMSSGIYLNNVDDCNIYNNSITRSNWGMEVRQSDLNNITNNDISNNGYYGIYADNSHYNTIANNTCNSNGGEGITVYASHNNNITNNTCNINKDNGIHVYSANYNEVLKNTCELNNNGAGIEVTTSSTGNIIKNNSCIYNSRGISIKSSSFNNISSNNCSNNDYDGMKFESNAVNNSIHNNIIDSNLYYAIFLLSSSDGNVFNNNSISNNTKGVVVKTKSNKFFTNDLISDGINIEGDYSILSSQEIPVNNTKSGKPIYYLADSHMNNATLGMNTGQIILVNVSYYKIENQNLSDLKIGLQISYSSYITAANCTCSNNNLYGIYVHYSNNITLVNNTCENNEYNIMIQYSEDNNVTKNNCSGGYYGFRVQDSDNNIITDNIFRNSVQFYTSINNTLHNNTIVGSDIRFYSGNNFITNNTVSDCGNAFLILSSDNRIENNTITNASSGISLSSGTDNVVKNNTINAGGFTGISLSNSENNKFYDNELNDCGFYLGNSYNSFTTQVIPPTNTVNGRSVAYYKNVDKNNGSVLSDYPGGVGQVILGNVTYLKIENLNLSSQSIGIVSGYSSNNYIANNNCSFNTQNGIILYYSNNNYLYNNSFGAASKSWCIFLDYSNDNEIIENTINQTERGGISIQNSKRNILNNNSIKKLDRDYHGIYLTGSTDTRLYSNLMENGGLYLTGGLPEFSTQTIPLNNTVDGKPVYYYNNTDMGNISVPLDAGQIIFGNISNLRIENHYFRNKTVGILGGFSDYIHIANCTIVNSSEYGIYLKSVNYVKIMNNTIADNEDDGVYLYSVCNNLEILYNNITNHGPYDSGIYIDETTDSIISNNLCNYNNRGIYVDGTKNRILNNTCLYNDDGLEIYSYDSRVENNTCSYNSERGIYLSDSEYSTISDNICEYNGEQGMEIWGPDYQNITNNICSYNDQTGLEINSGAMVYVANNTCNNNNRSGIDMDDLAQQSKVENNTCSNNNLDGMKISSFDNVEIIFNRLFSNNLFGINFSSTSGSNMIHHNDFYDNNGGGVQANDEDSLNYWDDGVDEGNFWSDYRDRYPGAKTKSPIWDTPYELAGSGNLQDNYPLVHYATLTYSPHPAIRINNNSDFTNASGVIHGDGSEADPYIIDGWDVDGTSLGNGIYIGNTTDHFVLSNCYAHDADSKLWDQYYWESGIVLYNLTNGTIEGCFSENNYYNIFLQYASNITVKDSTSSSSTYGTFVQNSDNITIQNNTFIDDSTGIYTQDTINSTILENNCSVMVNAIQMWSGANYNKIMNNDCSGYPISLSSVIHNTLYNNTCSGINSYTTSFNVINNNTIENGDVGIYLSSSMYIEVYNNTMEADGVYLTGSSESHYTTHSIPENNTISGKPIYYYVNADLGSSTAAPDAGQVICAKASNLIVDNLVLAGLIAAVNIAYSSHITVSNSNFSYNQYGIQVKESNNITIGDNTCSWNTITGIHVSGVKCRDLLIFENTASNNQNGINIFSASWSTIRNNTCNHNVDGGIYLDSTHNNTISDNTITNTQKYGIALEDSQFYNIFVSNICLYNSIGIWVESEEDQVRWNQFSSNNCSYSDEQGIFINLHKESSSKNNYFTNNSCCLNNESGIRLERSEENHFIHNDIISTIGYGFVATVSSSNNWMHHNNFIDNNPGAVQAIDHGTNNAWNSSDYEGNYWSDFATRYPSAVPDGRVWNQTYVIDGAASAWDYFPLVYPVEYQPPALTDLTLGYGYTGDEFVFRCLANDNIAVGNVYAKYWYGDYHNNSDNVSLEYNEPSNNWIQSILIRSNSTEPLNYNLSVVDVNNNWIGQLTKIVTITDNDLPAALAETDKVTYLEGDTVYFNGTGSTDNIGIVNYSWHFEYDLAMIFLYGKNQWFKFDIPGDYYVTHTVKDVADNYHSDFIWVNVTPVRKPEFSNLNYPGSKNIGEKIEVSLSVIDYNGGGITSAGINYTDVNGNTYNFTMNHLIGDIWNFAIDGQPNTGSVNFFVWARNNFGKTNKTSTHAVIIKDNILPEIRNVIYPDTVYVNLNIVINADVYDNIGISEVKVVYIDVNDNSHNASMIKGAGSTYSSTITGQGKEGIVTFNIWLSDVNDNVNKTKNYIIDVVKEEVKDEFPPFVVKTKPANGTHNVYIDTQVTITFNESMNINSIVSSIYIEPSISFDLFWENDDKMIRIVFAENLSYNQNYTITIDVGAKDLAGNPLTEKFHLVFFTEPEPLYDSDLDNIPDYWENEHKLDPYDPNDAYWDNDHDGLDNLGEYLAQTDPKDSDTDDDGMSDGWEVDYGLKPLIDDAGDDADSDGYSNLEEYEGGSDPRDRSSTPEEKEEAGPNYAILGIVVVVLILIFVILLLWMKRRAVEEEEIKREEEGEEGLEETAIPPVEEDVYIEDDLCPECGTYMGDDETVCPECGAEFAWEEYEEEDEDEFEE